jgi:hypothetical protein
MSPLPILMFALCLGAAACGGDPRPEPPKFAEVMPNVPLPPQATFVSKSGGADALQLTVRSPARADVVAAFYREKFKRDGWRLVNDARDREGAVVFFAEQDGPPLWVRIRNAEDGRGTLVEITGARVTRTHDSTKVPAAPPAKPTS